MKPPTRLMLIGVEHKHVGNNMKQHETWVSISFSFVFQVHSPRSFEVCNKDEVDEARPRKSSRDLSESRRLMASCDQKTWQNSWEDCEKWTYFGKILAKFYGNIMGIPQNSCPGHFPTKQYLKKLLLGWANVETMVKTCENKHKWWQVFVVSQALDKRILDLRSTHDEDPSIQMIPCRIFWGPSLPNLSTCPPHLRSHMCQWQ